MKHSYKKVIDKIQFSEDFEQQVLSNLYQRQKVSHKKLCFAKSPMLWIPLCGALIICIACMPHFIQPNMKKPDPSLSAILEENEIHGIESIKILELQKKDGLFKLSRHPLKAKEMLIIDFNLTVNSNSTISLQGSMEYADSNYGIGYLLNGTFHDVQKTSMDGTVDCSITLKESGTFYWCINNTSGNTNYFSGNIQYRPDPPVYRDYGAGAISAEEGCTIQLSHIQGLLGDTEITGIFVYCHEKNMAKGYPEDTDSITFTVPEKGTYSIYALTKQGGLMNLNAYLSVDYPSDYKISNTT